MSLTITENAQIAASKTGLNPQIVLAIDGVSTIFGAGIIEKFIKIGDPGLKIGGGWVIGGVNSVDDQLDLISISGTSTQIQQQLTPDKGLVSSDSSISVALIDQANQISKIISPGQVITDILGTNAQVYLGFKGTAYPDDYVQVFQGIIDDIQSCAGLVTLDIAAPSVKQNQTIFTKATASLGGAPTSATISIASPAVITSVAHGLIDDQPISFATTGSLPTGITAGTVYFVKKIDADTFNISQDAGGTAIDTSGSQSGTQTWVAGITAGMTTVPIAGANKIFFSPQIGPLGDTGLSICTPCLKIDDEIIPYTSISITGNSLNMGIDPFTGINYGRGQLGTTPAAHNPGANVESLFILSDDAMHMALRIMLSRPASVIATATDSSAVSDIDIESFGWVEQEQIPNAIYFKGVDIIEKYGLVSGDFIRTSGSSVSTNNSDPAWFEIDSIITTTSGSYAIVPSLNQDPGDGFIYGGEINSSAIAAFRSQFDTLPDGLGMKPWEVDVDRHLFWRTLILFDMEYQFYLKDTITGRDFLENEIYLPCGAYALPRQGRASVGYHIGPIPTDEIVVLNEDNIKAPDTITLHRCIARYFYNTINYEYDEAVSSTDLNTSKTFYDSGSLSRIPVGTTSLDIKSHGLRSTLTSDSVLERSALRRLQRYRYAAESFEGVGVLFGPAFFLEPGDLVVVDPSNLQITNTDDGTREKPAKFFEVMNRTIDLASGDVQLDLVDTNFGAGERYGIISPSSVISASGTNATAKIMDSYGALFPGNEQKKWANYIGEQVQIHSVDFSSSYITTLSGFSATDSYLMEFDPALPVNVQAGWIVDLAPYSTDANKRTNHLSKLFHCFWAPDVAIVSGTDDKTFSVASENADKFLVGLPIRVHSSDFSDFSDETTIASVSGTTITVEDSLGFIPGSTHTASLLGFSDGGQCYRWL